MDIEKTIGEYDRLLNELARMMPDDPKYKETLDAAEKLAKIIGEYERRDLERINNNVRNDINEENVRVDMAKVKSDRLRSWLDLAKAMVGVAGSGLLAAIAYKGEMIDFKLPIRTLMDLGKGLLPKR